MSLNEETRRDAAVGQRIETGAAPTRDATTSPDIVHPPGTPDHTGVSPQNLVVDTPQPTVKADLTERQAVEVRPMRYVLGLGLGLAIVAMLVVWIFFR